LKRFALIVLAGLLAAMLGGPAGADTFELSDPANEMNERPQAEEESVSESGQELPEKAVCTVDIASGACTCIDKVMARKLPLTQQECADRVRRSLDSR
jgi:hypothetical protein